MTCHHILVSPPASKFFHVAHLCSCCSPICFQSGVSPCGGFMSFPKSWGPVQPPLLIDFNGIFPQNHAQPGYPQLIGFHGKNETGKSHHYLHGKITLVSGSDFPMKVVNPLISPMGFPPEVLSLVPSRPSSELSKALTRLWTTARCQRSCRNCTLAGQILWVKSGDFTMNGISWDIIGI